MQVKPQFKCRVIGLFCFMAKESFKTDGVLVSRCPLVERGKLY